MRSFSSLDLSDVLTRLGVEHKRKGHELFARCPFHEERTPSWSIRADGSDRHGLWRCKGACVEPDDRGSVVTLVARLLNLTREDGSPDRQAAVLWLTGEEDAPAEPPPLALELDVSTGEVPRAFGLPPGVLVRPASEWSSLPLRYLVGDRGVPAEQVDRWGLGYALSGKLAGRVVLPVRDAAGYIKSYSARTFVGDRLKWKSADRSDRPDQTALFGEAFWPASDRASVVVVEAALDALAVESATDRRRSVAAIHGSEPLDEHLAKFATFREVLVATDPDDAGEKIHAAVRGSLGRWTRVRRVSLPGGLDASALWHKEPDELRRRLAP